MEQEGYTLNNHMYFFEEIKQMAPSELKFCYF